MNEKQFTFIDLFAGTGGLSEGFIQTGAKPIAFIENDADACSTIRTRQAFHYLKENGKLRYYWQYLRKAINRDKLYKFTPDAILESVICEDIAPETISSLIERINLKEEKLDILLGGPPCQSYSHAGKSRREKIKDDPRNWLYKSYARFLKELRPKVFVFENVMGFRTAGDSTYYENFKRIVSRAGYKVDSTVLCAADFSVLQNRKRLIIIGWRKDIDFNYPVFKKEKNGYLVGELFEDLPAIKAGESLDKLEYLTKPKGYLKKTNVRNGCPVLTWHESRPNNEVDLEIYRFTVDLWNNKRKRLIYSDLPERLRTHKNLVSFKDRFKVVAADLPASQTILAHIAKDGHYYIHPDIEQNRSISVREAARLQSFPDDYYFEGSRCSALRQIGNAVPPLMARKIAEKIKEML